MTTTMTEEPTPEQVVEAMRAAEEAAAIKGNFNPFELPDGRRVLLSDFLAGSYYSAIVLSAEQLNDNRQSGTWELFGYGVSQQIAGGLIAATRAHTNIPRPGSVGLPRDWEGFVAGWRARVSVDHPVVRSWAANTQASFRYREKEYYEAPLLDLFDREAPVVTATEGHGLLHRDEAAVMAMSARLGMNLVHLQENLSYRVVLQSSARALSELQEWLEGAEDAETTAKLHELSKMAAGSDERVARHIRAAIKAIKVQGRTLMCWVYLDGVWRRPVV